MKPEGGGGRKGEPRYIIDRDVRMAKIIRDKISHSGLDPNQKSPVAQNVASKQ